MDHVFDFVFRANTPVGTGSAVKHLMAVFFFILLSCLMSPTIKADIKLTHLMTIIMITQELFDDLQSYH